MAHHFKSVHFGAFNMSAVFILLTAMHAAQADTTVYKYTGPDGVTVYTQSLPENYSPSAVTTITIQTLPVEEQRAAVRMLGAMQNQAAAGMQERRSKLDEADRQVNDAITNLQKAEAALQSGSKPTGTDRIGKVGGGTRLRESYFQRVEQLQRAVDNAKLALEQAYRKRNDLR
ncbi:MAG: DUF4124 domain-containing protein [Gallionella sp.]